MALLVEQLSLGPLGTNCYVVRAASGADEAAVVDPSGDATELRLLLARMGDELHSDPRDAGHWDHLLGVADLAEGTGAPVYMPEGERELLESAAAVHAGGVAVRPYTPEVLLRRGDTVEVAGITFQVLSVPGHSPDHLAYYADGSLFAGDVLFAGSVGRTDLPGRGLGRRCSGRSGRSLDDVSIRDGRVSRSRPDQRRSAASSTATRSSPSCARRRREQGRDGRASPWHTRRDARRAAALAARHGGDRAAVRRLRLPAHHDAGVRGHGALRADIGCRLGRRPERDVHVPDRSAARSRCVPRRPRRSAARTSSTGSGAEPQPGSSSRSRRCTATRRPARGREHWQASVEAIGRTTPRVDAELIQLYDALLGRLGVTRYELELNSIGCRECRTAYLERLRGWLSENASRLDDRRGEGRDEPPAGLRQPPGEAGRRARRARGGAHDRRVALRQRASSGSRSCGATSTRAGVAYTLVPTLVRGLDYYSRTTWEFVGPLEKRTQPSRAAAATTTSSRRSADLRRPASASARGSRGSSWRWRRRA